MCLFNSVFSQRCHKKWLRTEQSVNYWLMHEVICLHFFDSPRKRQTIQNCCWIFSGRDPEEDPAAICIDLTLADGAEMSCHCLQKKNNFLTRLQEIIHFGVTYQSKLENLK